MTAAARTQAVPALFHGLLDDAAVFPPGDAPLPEAVAAHLARRETPDAVFSGPLLCGWTRWDELVAALPSGGAALDLALVVAGGPAAVGPAVRAAREEPRVDLRGAEVAVDGTPQQVDLALAALQALPAGATGSVEVPIGPALAAAAERVAATRHRVKLRTGGLTAAAFPDEQQLAGALSACVRAGAPLKLTAGLHDAVRHRDPVTGFEHHGVLNVLLAVAGAVDGDAPARLAEVLAEQGEGVLVARVRSLDASAAAGVRRRWTSFGTCSTEEPLADLRRLGLLA